MKVTENIDYLFGLPQWRLADRLIDYMIKIHGVDRSEAEINLKFKTEYYKLYGEGFSITTNTIDLTITYEFFTEKNFDGGIKHHLSRRTFEGSHLILKEELDPYYVLSDPYLYGEIEKFL